MQQFSVGYLPMICNYLTPRLRVILTLPSMIVGSCQLMNFQFFPSDFNLLPPIPPVCKDFENIRPPDYCQPPKFN